MASPPPNQARNPRNSSNSRSQQTSFERIPRGPAEGEYGYHDEPSGPGADTLGATYFPDGGRSRYERVPATTAQLAANLPGITTYWGDSYPASHDDAVSTGSPIDPAALQFALPPDISQHSHPLGPHPDVADNDPYDQAQTPYYDEPPPQPYQDDSDRVPLAAAAAPTAGGLTTPVTATPRDSFQTVHDLGGSPSRSRDIRMLGHDLEPGFSRHRSYGHSLTPDDKRRSRSPSTSGALSRTASIVRAMSQRVVNISGEGEVLEQQARRQRSRSPSAEGRRSQRVSDPMLVDTSYPPPPFAMPAEKMESDFPRRPMPNPLKGKSLGIFSPDNPIRMKLCDILVFPWTEPIILILIILQAILLAVEAAPNVFEPGNARPQRWGTTRIDWAIFALFMIFTIELIARIIVSGFVLNAAEYSTIDRKKGIRAVVADQYKAIFQPQRQKSVRASRPAEYEPSTFARSFTVLQGQALPETVEEQQRMQLARRAFLRHGFNRLDFVAVVSFWISFVLGIAGMEHRLHLYVFRMLSCLRILRLLALTRGNAIILRSLKKAAPLLLRVSFLIGFFWLLFAIIGVQSFKTSLSRQCVWLDPLQPDNLTAAYTNDFEFCGGYLKNNTDPEPTVMPWVFMETPGDLTTKKNGTSSGKGFICPRGSLCLQQGNPHNGTVNFDDILHSLELVFVIMSANTFTDLMYYTTNSDFKVAALFFGAGIMIMMLWMTNLLIAVITSSFQVIREESKGSAFTVDQDETFMPAHAEDGLKRVSSLQRIYNKTSFIWVLIIVYDLVVQAFRSARMSDNRRLFIDTSEVVVTLLLDVEIIIRFAANWRGFHHGLQNLVDFFLALITSIILLPPIHNSGQTYAWLTVFQILRAYRVVLAIPMTRKLIQLVLGNATGIGNLMLFVFLMTFLVSIFASQLFRGQIPQADSDGNNIRITFATIFNSFLGMYQILTSENWTDILYNITGYSDIHHTAWIAAIFFCGWFILSFFILVNMFIAVIQENFDVGEDQKRLEQVRAFLQRKELGSSSSNLALSTIFSFGKRKQRKDPLDYGPAMMEMLLKEAVVREFLDESMDPLQETQDGGHAPPVGSGSPVKAGKLSSVWTKIVQSVTNHEQNPFYSNVRYDAPTDGFDPRQMARQAVESTNARRREQREYLARHPNYNTSLYIFKPNHPLRRLCQSLVGPGRGSERIDGVEPNKIAWYTFSAFIYATIVVMVVLACVTTPLYQKEYFDRGHIFGFHNWFVWTDMAFAIVFTTEAIIKVIADGFLWTPNAYFRSSWGFIDAIVLITLWINVFTLFANDGAVSRAVGAFKALRALRLLNVSDSARETFHMLIIVGGWKILSAAFVSISLLIPFAIYGLNIFNGKMVKCNDTGSIVNLVDCFGEFNATPFNNDWPLLAPRAAANDYFSFDDFGESLFILYQIVSQEGWTDVSFAAQAITSRGTQPQFGVAQGNAVFFVVFNLLATVFILTLFISVFMRNYTEQTGVAFLTAEQRSWLELRKLLRQISPSKSSYDDTKNKWKKWCHKRAIEKRGKWHLAITAILVLHLVLLLLEFSTEPMWWSEARDYVFFLFTLIYMVNITIRIFGLGWTRFRRSSWDLFSLVAVAGTFVTTIMFLVDRQRETFIQLHKYFLVAIVLLLIPRNDALDQLFKTAAASLTSIVNLLATWLVFYLVFAIAMTQAFSLTRFAENEKNNINFRTVPNALILLFRMSLGEGWNAIMEDYATVEPPLCVEGSTFFQSDCGSPAWARVLFIMWNIISMYIFVNLFVSLIYESFSYVYQRSSGLAEVDRDEIRRFKEAWRSVDPAGTGYISKEVFPRLLGELSGVFQMRIYDPEDTVGAILDDVRNGPDMHQGRHASIASKSALGEIDLQRLNDRLRNLDVAKVRERRRRFNIFYEEVMVSADPDRGIAFTTVLMILAHYNIISDSKSLKLDEFLRRRARLQRVEEEVRRRIVLGFFDTLYWSRKFKRHMELKRSARMTAVPRLDVPDIFVDDEEERAATASAAADASAHRFTQPPPSRTPSVFLSADDAHRQHHRSWSGASEDISFQQFPYEHPLSMPRSNNTTSATAAAAANSPGTPTGGADGSGGHHGHSSSAYSFELQDGGGGGLGSQPGSAHSSRRGSAVSPAQARELLDDSIWVESIRRSATMRRSGWGNQ